MRPTRTACCVVVIVQKSLGSVKQSHPSLELRLLMINTSPRDRVRQRLIKTVERIVYKMLSQIWH